MDRSAGVTLVACALVVALALPGGAGAGAASAANADAAPVPAPQTDDVDPDRVVMRADVEADGSATWVVEYRIRLDDENVTAAFESLRDDIRANRSAYADQFASRMGGTVTAASNATGREMRLTNVSVTGETRQLPQSYGVVSYRFEWVGFAQVDGDRLIVGDALAGLFLDSESRLFVSWPEGYEASSVEPGGYEEREGTVVWTGPVDFGPDQPRIVLRPAGGPPVAAFAVGALLLVGIAVAGWTYRRRRADDGTRAAPASGADAGDEAGDGSAAAEPDGPPEDLLSPEERVLRLVRERGGRVKQQAVVEEFDWTAARTSQVVGSLREDGRIETFRLGRENVLTLPDTGVVVDDGDAEDGDEEGDGDDGGVDWRP